MMMTMTMNFSDDCVEFVTMMIIMRRPPHETAKSSASQSLEALPPRSRSRGKSEVLRSQSLADSNYQHLTRRLVSPGAKT